MHEHVQAFVAGAAGAFRLRGPVYRFGPRRLRDSPMEASLRDCFAEAAYVDVGLQRAVRGRRLATPAGAARTVLCLGVGEPGLGREAAWQEIGRILSPGGVLLACASVEDPVPGRVSARWRLTPRSLDRLLATTSATLVGWQGAEELPHTIYGIGFKPPVRRTILDEIRQFLDRFQARLDEAAARVGWPVRAKSWLTGWLRGPARRRHRRDYYKVRFAVHLAVDQDFQPAALPGGPGDESTGTRLDLME